MPQRVRQNDSIEGQVVDGSSRDPLITRGKRSTPAGICNCFIADFDVDASIVKSLSPGTVQIDPTSDIAQGSRVICQKSIVLSFEKKPQTQVINRTGRHKASAWHFPKQTLAKIDRAHQELVNAIENRLAQLDGSDHTAERLQK